jgi:hypothetical protein
MKIVMENNIISLIKDNEEIINISEDSIVEYTGIYYKEINDIVDVVKIETSFIGRVDCVKYNQNCEGFQGIYIVPLFIWDKLKSEWKKIINYKEPHSKYFHYPHLLKLSEYIYLENDLDYLITCKNRSLSEFKNITNSFLI